MLIICHHVLFVEVCHWLKLFSEWFEVYPPTTCEFEIQEVLIVSQDRDIHNISVKDYNIIHDQLISVSTCWKMHDYTSYGC